MRKEVTGFRNVNSSVLVFKDHSAKPQIPCCRKRCTEVSQWNTANPSPSAHFIKKRSPKPGTLKGHARNKNSDKTVPSRISSVDCASEETRSQMRTNCWRFAKQTLVSGITEGSIPLSSNR